MKADIENVKKAGIAEALSKAIHNALWQVKCASEDASKDSYKNFKREVARARDHLDAAVAFHDELRAQK
jgi:hypothetical protein